MRKYNTITNLGLPYSWQLIINCNVMTYENDQLQVTRLIK